MTAQAELELEDLASGVAKDPADQAWVDAVRRAAARLDAGPVDELALRRLRQRLAVEGLLPASTQRWRPILATAAAVTLCLGVTLQWSVVRRTESKFPGPPPHLDAVGPKITVGQVNTPLQVDERKSAAARPAPGQRSLRRMEESAVRAAPGEAPPAAAKLADSPRREPAVPRLSIPSDKQSEFRAALQRLLASQPNLEAEPLRTDSLRVRCADPLTCRSLEQWLNSQGLDVAGPLPDGVELWFARPSMP